MPPAAPCRDWCRRDGGMRRPRSLAPGSSPEVVTGGSVRGHACLPWSNHQQRAPTPPTPPPRPPLVPVGLGVKAVCHALGLGHCLTSSTTLRPQGDAVGRHGREGCQLPTSKTMRVARTWRGRVARQPGVPPPRRCRSAYGSPSRAAGRPPDSPAPLAVPNEVVQSRHGRPRGQADTALVADRPPDPQHRPGRDVCGDVGFALLFPTAGVALPSLHEAASEQPMPLAETGWGPDEQRVWGWKDAPPWSSWAGRWCVPALAPSRSAPAGRAWCWS